MEKEISGWTCYDTDRLQRLLTGVCRVSDTVATRITEEVAQVTGGEPIRFTTVTTAAGPCLMGLAGEHASTSTWSVTAKARTSFPGYSYKLTLHEMEDA